MSRVYETLSQMVARTEREEFGTNDWREIQKVIRQQNAEEAQANLTGMDQEQANWEEDDDE